MRISDWSSDVCSSDLLEGILDASLGVPVLTAGDQICEKLLANADRCLDRALAYRDAIDLGYLVKASGLLPADAVAQAEAAYGDDLRRKHENGRPSWRERLCLSVQI